MPQKLDRLNKRMGEARRAETTPSPSGASLSASEIVTVIRRLGYVALTAYDVIQGNLTSRGNYRLAEALGDTLKPLVDMLVHFELEDVPDTEVDNGEV